MTEPRKSGYTWQTVTVAQADGVSAPIDLTAAAIIAIVTPTAAHVALFWIQVDVGGTWHTLAKEDGTALDLTLMAARAMPIPIEYTRPYDRARLAMPTIMHDYTYQVCIEALVGP